MTNYERIKNMSVEEMAEFIHEISMADQNGLPYCSIDIAYERDCTCDDCVQHTAEWLNSEVEE